jgi:hypothetical protein
MRKTYTKLSYSQVVDLGILIRSHCTLHEGYAVYEKGWSDEIIAEKFGLSKDTSHVSKLRLQLVGPFTPAGNRSVSRYALADLEARISRIEAELGMVPEKKEVER